MLSRSFSLFLLIIVSVQADNYNTFIPKGFENGYPLGQIRHLVANQNQDSLSELPRVNQDQPVSSPCVGVRPNMKVADPTDNTKYYQCRRDFRYEIVTCPNGGIFDNEGKACIDLCEQKKPCLNDGQCIILSNLTLQCICRRDWTGDQCEIPLSSCVNKPCGANAECRMLKSTDYTQDYVCICNNLQSYGRNCQQTVPNPCLRPSQQFHPFAFSRTAYINCDDERIFFQPCNSILYWNQEKKRCDRTLPDIFKIPSKQWQNQQVDATIQQQPFISQFERNQQWSQNNQQQWTPTYISGSNMGQFQRTQENQQQQNFPTQILPEQKQGLVTQQWQNPAPDFKTQTNQRFAIQSQPWQGSQTIQYQPSLTNNFMETTTASPRIIHLQGFLSQNSGEQKSQWQTNANNQIQSSVNFKTQSAVQPQSLQESQLINNQPWSQGQNQQTLSSNFPESTSQRQPEQSQGNQLLQSVDFKTLNNQGFVTQPKQWPGTLTVLRQQIPPETQQTNDFTSQNQNQQSLTSETNSQIQKPSQFNLNQQSWQNTPDNQQLPNQSSDFKIQTNQNIPPQTQSRTDQLTSFPLETTTMSNKNVQQGGFIQTLRGWKSSR